LYTNLGFAKGVWLCGCVAPLSVHFQLAVGYALADHCVLL